MLHESHRGSSSFSHGRCDFEAFTQTGNQLQTPGLYCIPLVYVYLVLVYLCCLLAVGCTTMTIKTIYLYLIFIFILSRLIFIFTFILILPLYLNWSYLYIYLYLTFIFIFIFILILSSSLYLSYLYLYETQFDGLCAAPPLSRRGQQSKELSLWWRKRVMANVCDFYLSIWRHNKNVNIDANKQTNNQLTWDEMPQTHQTMLLIWCQLHR